MYALGGLLGLVSNGSASIVLRGILCLDFRSVRSTMLPSDLTPSPWFSHDDTFDDSTIGAGHGGMRLELVAGG